MTIHTTFKKNCCTTISSNILAKENIAQKNKNIDRMLSHRITITFKMQQSETNNIFLASYTNENLNQKLQKKLFHMKEKQHSIFKDLV